MSFRRSPHFRFSSRICLIFGSGVHVMIWVSESDPDREWSLILILYTIIWVSEDHQASDSVPEMVWSAVLVPPVLASRVCSINSSASSLSIPEK